MHLLLYEAEDCTLQVLADWAHEVFSEHFVLTPDHPTEPDDFIAIALRLDWDRGGSSPAEIIAQEAGIDEKIATDLVHLLSEVHSYAAVRGGEEDPYDNYDTRYEAAAPNPETFRKLWDSVPSEIRHRARFFNTEAEHVLENIFGDLSKLTTEHGIPVITELGTPSPNAFIWRARTALSKEKAETILKSPAQELGPPPAEHATAGRMNPEGIPVFYGAMDLSTCIAEVRPPVGSYVVAGRFKLLRTVRVLDMNLLQEVYAEPNYFHPHYADLSNRIAFLKQLVDELTRPVMPGDEAREYLATQVVAEYLAHKTVPRLDGILFRSSQMNFQYRSGNEQVQTDERNVVLFNHASRVQPIEVPDYATVEARIPPRNGGDDHNSTVTIWELLDEDPRGHATVAATASANTHQDGTGNGGREAVLPTLQLDADSLVVLDIHRMEPIYTEMPTESVRINKSDLPWPIHGPEQPTDEPDE